MDPTHLDDSRSGVKFRLVRTVRVFGLLGFGEGVAGHVTVRDPLAPDHYWVNPFKVDFTQVRGDDLLLMSPSGRVVEGDGDINPSVHPIHGELHRARPNAKSFVHAHSIYGRTWSALGRRLDPITQDACAIFGRHSTYGPFQGLVADDVEGKAIAHALGDGVGVFLQNHGHLTCGRSVEEAAWWYVVLERTAQAQLLAEAAGTPLVISEAVAARAATQLGDPALAEIQFVNLCAATFGAAQLPALEAALPAS